MAADPSTAPPRRGLRAIDPSPFRLRLERADEPPGPPPAATQVVGLAGVLADLNRAIRPFGRRFGAPWGARRARGMTGGFCFDHEDSDTPDWYPQGISASPDGGVVLVSWYRRGTSEARVSLVDLAARAYRHVRLTTAALEPVRSHAGGLAWRGDLLYVADTRGGLRVFDLRGVLRTEAGYALPQTGRYALAGARLRFSYASVDPAADGLLVGEYLDKAPGARLVRWAFGPDGLLRPEPAAAAWVTGHTNLQGAVAVSGRLLMAESRGVARAGTLHVSPFDETSERRRWAVGCEDLALAGEQALSLGEHPDLPRPLARRRAVFTTAP